MDERANARRLAVSTAIFSGATGLSRLLGLVREIVVANYFGARGSINAFTIAFQIPNLIRALVADAALSSAFVPVFSELLEKGEKARAWRVASTIFWLFLLVGSWADRALHPRGAGAHTAPHRRVRRPRSDALADPLPDRRPARPLRDRDRDPEQLRAVHHPGADARLLEPGDHRRARDRRAARRHGQRQALRLRGLDRRRHRDPAPPPASLAPRPRRPPAARARRSRPGREAGLQADDPRHARARPDQRQRGDRHRLRVEADRPDHRPERDRQGLPRLHAPAGDVLGRGRDGALPLPRAGGDARRHGGLSRHRLPRAAPDQLPAPAGERALGRPRAADRASPLRAGRLRSRTRPAWSPERSPPFRSVSPSTG